jgi:hypothetical protein
LATESLANKTSNFLAHFLILVLSLLKALRPSTSIYGTPAAVASSIWAALASIQTLIIDFVPSSCLISYGEV